MKKKKVFLFVGLIAVSMLMMIDESVSAVGIGAAIGWVIWGIAEILSTD